jgi:hypothetical protein
MERPNAFLQGLLGTERSKKTVHSARKLNYSDPQGNKTFITYSNLGMTTTGEPPLPLSP